MTGWWAERSPRERTLLAVLGGLVALWLLAVLVVRPLQAARSGALADIRTYETLNARLRQGGLVAPGQTRLGGAPETAIRQSAAAAGLTLASVAADGSGLRVRVAQGSWDAILRWTAELERTSDLRVRRLRMTRGAAPGLADAELFIA